MSAVLQHSKPQPPEVVHAIALRLDEATRARLAEASGLVAVAEACTVDCHDMAVVAKVNLDSVIAFRKDLEGRRKKFVEPAMQIIENAKAEYNPSILAAEQAEGIYRRRLGEYQMAEQRRIDDARRKQQEEERRIREQAERDAAAARARAEVAAAESRRKAEEAAAAEAKARSEGNARAAAAAAAARAKAEEEERQRRDGAEREAQRIEMEAASRQSTTVIPEQEKVAGLSLRDNWVAEIDPRFTENTNAAKLELVKAIAGGRADLLAMIEIDMSAAGKLAKALKENFNAPGLKAFNRRIPVNRKG